MVGGGAAERTSGAPLEPVRLRMALFQIAQVRRQAGAKRAAGRYDSSGDSSVDSCADLRTWEAGPHGAVNSQVESRWSPQSWKLARANPAATTNAVARMAIRVARQEDIRPNSRAVPCGRQCS